MENIWIAIALGVIPAFVGFNACLKFWRETSERQMFFEAQKHLLDKLGSAAEVTQFLASGEGKDFIDRLKPPPPEPPKPPSPADVLFLLIWVGMIVIGIGAGFYQYTRLLPTAWSMFRRSSPSWHCPWRIC